MATVKFTCEHCGKVGRKEVRDVNRARTKGMRLFCGRICFGLDRRKWKPKEQKVAEKRAYDAEYRKKNAALLKAKKHEYFQHTYDPDSARIERQKRMPYHVEYCRRPYVQAKKSAYDIRYNARRAFGEFSDAFLVLRDLDAEIASRMSKYEIYSANGTLNKTLRRRQEYDSFVSG